MAHTSRSRRTANERRRAAAALKQPPLSAAEQLARHGERAAAHAARYPVPPVYTDAWGRTARRQPGCYELPGVFLENPFVPFLGRLMARATARRARK